MKTLLTAVCAALLVAFFAVSADAATKKKDAGMATKEATCKAQSKQKYSAVHVLKRRAYVKKCMGEA